MYSIFGNLSRGFAKFIRRKCKEIVNLCFWLVVIGDISGFPVHFSLNFHVIPVIELRRDVGAVSEEFHTNQTGERDDLTDNALSVRRLDNGIHFRGLFQFLLIDVVLVSQTAHEPSAGTGNFRGIERQVLFFCHFDGDLHEIGQK